LSADLDTSALVKRYVAEPESALLAPFFDAGALATSRITWAEARAALARRERESPLAAAALAEARRKLSADWPALRLVEVTQPVVERAGDLADVFALRGYDAVQLASAEVVWRVLDERLVFVSFDRRLNRSARLLGLSLPEGAPD
jgi:predicted nucleic acid-binding protein